MRRTILLALLFACSAVPAPLAPAQSSRFAAVFGEGGSISWTEFYLELARRHRGKQLGKDALNHLIEKQIVTLEAAHREVSVAAAEIDQRVALLEKQLAGRDLSLDKHLADRGLTLAEFRDYVRLSILYDRLARHDLGLASTDTLSADNRQLWLREKQRQHGATTDMSKIPPGVAAIVGGQQITLGELGKTMARNLVEDERHSLLRQMVAYRLLRQEAERRDIEITEADHDAAIERKRQELATDPQYVKLGLTLEKMLQAQGRSLEDLRQGEVFRAEVLIGALGGRLFPTEQLEAAWKKDILLWQGRIGSSRETHRLFVAGPPRRSKEKAKQLLASLASRIRTREDFAAAARRFSEDKNSKRRGGNLGFLHRKEHGLDERLLATAFRLPLGKVSDPCEDGGGYSLVLVTEIRPGPTGAARWATMRRWKVAAWLRDLVEKANVRFSPLPR